MLLFNRVCTLVLMYTFPNRGVQGDIVLSRGTITLGWGVNGKLPWKKIFGMFVGQQFMGPWYWVTRGIFPWYFPIVKWSLWLCERDYERVKRKCSEVCCSFYPFIFVRWYSNKGLEISVWTYPILGEPRYIGVFLVMCLCFNIYILFIVIVLWSCFLTIGIRTKCLFGWKARIK